MKIYPITDPAFKPYGKILEGFDTAELLAAMKKIDLPESGTAYEPSIKALEDCAVFTDLRDRAFGGMPVELGMCWGRNTKLNCLEYHRDSELNMGTDDFILLLAREDEIVDGVLDTANVKAFLAPAGVLVEIYATTLHYAPCHANAETGFRVLAALPKGTNDGMPEIKIGCEEDKMLFARNKWLLAHPDAPEASNGAYVGLKGENIDIAGDL